MKRKLCIIATLIVIVCSAVYLYFDGLILYKIQKVITPPLKLIEYYTDKDFPSETIIDSVEYEIYSDPIYSESLDAKLTLPAHMVDVLFPEEERSYDSDYAKRLLEDKQLEFDFGVKMYEVVRRTRFKTQPVIEFAVSKPEDDTVKVYVSIDLLGFYRCNK